MPRPDNHQTRATADACPPSRVATDDSARLPYRAGRCRSTKVSLTPRPSSTRLDDSHRPRLPIASMTLNACRGRSPCRPQPMRDAEIVRPCARARPMAATVVPKTPRAIACASVGPIACTSTAASLHRTKTRRSAHHATRQENTDDHTARHGSRGLPAALRAGRLRDRRWHRRECVPNRHLLLQRLKTDAHQHVAPPRPDARMRATEG